MKLKNYVLMGVCLMGLYSCATSYIDKRAESPNFKGGVFFNLEKQDAKTFFTFLKMRLSTDWPSWPEWVEQKKSTHANLQKRNQSDTIHLTHINHSTVLLQTKGINILTDPIYSERCSPVSFAGPKRVTKPGLEFDQLPQIDFVLISHDHYDHLDLETIRMLIKRDNPVFYVGLGVGRHFPAEARVFEMDWWQTIVVNEGFKINFVPVQHFSGRGLFDRNSTLWGGFFLEMFSKKIYFGGDTGYAGHFRETKKRYGSPDLAILPIGAYAPRDFMQFAHMNPADAVQAHIDLESKKSFGVHYGTFQLTAEPIDEPIELLVKELKSKQIPTEAFVTSSFGETLVL